MAPESEDVPLTSIVNGSVGGCNGKLSAGRGCCAALEPVAIESTSIPVGSVCTCAGRFSTGSDGWAPVPVVATSATLAVGSAGICVGKGQAGGDCCSGLETTIWDLYQSKSRAISFDNTGFRRRVGCGLDTTLGGPGDELMLEELA